MGSPARDPELVVEDAVVLVGDLLVGDVLVLGGGHHHQVGEGVAQVAGVVHVDVGGAGEPSVVGDVGDFGEPDGRVVDLALPDHRLECEGLRLEAAHNGDLGRSGREFHGERAGVVEDPVSGAGYAGVGVGGGVELAVRGGQVDAAGDGVVVGVDGGQRQGARGARPMPLADVDPAECAAVGFEKVQLRQPALVGHERDPLRIGGPARVEGVEVEKGHLVRFAAGGGLHVQVLELVGGARGGRVDEALAVVRNMRLRAVQGLLRQDDLPVLDAADPRRDPVHVAAAERHVAVGDEEQLVAARQPCGRDVHVPGAEVEAVAAEGVVRGDRDFGSGPGAVREGADVDVEVAAGRGGHVGDAVAGRGEAGIGVDVFAVGEAVAGAGGRVHDLEVDGAAAVVGGVEQPHAVGGIVGGGVVVGAVHDLEGVAGCDVDFPERAAHGDRDAIAAGVPGGVPGRRGGRRGKMEVVHVVPAVRGGGVGAPWLREEVAGWGEKGGGEGGREDEVGQEWGHAGVGWGGWGVRHSSYRGKCGANQPRGRMGCTTTQWLGCAHVGQVAARTPHPHLGPATTHRFAPTHVNHGLHSGNSG